MEKDEAIQIVLEQITDSQASLANRMDAVEKFMREGETPKSEVDDFLKPSFWTQEAFNPPGIIDGIVTDEALARSTPCKRVNLGNTELWYSRGIVGALNEEQKLLYCENESEAVKVSPQTQHALNVINDAVTLCQREVEDNPVAGKLEPFLKCLTVTAKKQGVNI